MYKNSWLIFLIFLFVSGCAGWTKHYGKNNSLPEHVEVTIGDLINNFEDYHVDYTGLDAKAP